MKVFKFGGASVKDAQGVKNLVSVLETTAEQNLVVIISAMGKMTNALEKVVDGYFEKPANYKIQQAAVATYHTNIMEELFPNRSHPIYKEVAGLMTSSPSRPSPFNHSPSM